MKNEKINDDLKEILFEQDKKVLVKLIFKQANKYPDFLSSLIMEFGDKEEYENELFDKYKTLISKELIAWTRYRVPQLHNYHIIKNTVRQLNEFCKHCKNKNMEADLLMLILDHIFENYKTQLGTIYVKFDNKTAITLQRAINLVSNKLHPDYQNEYIDKLNSMVNILKISSTSLNSVFKLSFID